MRRGRRSRADQGGPMTEAGWAVLRQRLLTRYAVFKKRLTKYLGSADLAGEALQDTWLRLERGGELSALRSPDNYLYSMAVNIARNRIQAESRRLSASEVGALLDIADEAPDPARAAEARSELRAIVAIIAELPERRQAILLAARVDGLPRREIARRFGVSVRFVQRELHEAQVYCVERSRKLTDGSFRSRSRALSTDQKSFRTPGGKPAHGEVGEE
jgi:RNA polymerase sigma-70 factor (ECF subfamily)